MGSRSVGSLALADTSGLLAMAHPRDQYHIRAVAAARDFVRGGGRFVSTPLVLAELQGLLLYRSGPDVARRVTAALLEDAAFEWVEVNADVMAAAHSGWLERFRDQTFTLCHAVSFEVMRRGRIKKALAFDQHFVTAGFAVLD